MAEVLRTAVVGTHALATPTATLDPATRAVVDAEVAAAADRARHEGYAAGRAAAADDTARAVSGVVAALDRVHAEVADQRAAAIAADLDVVTAVTTAVLDAAPPPSTATVLDRIRAAAAALDDPVLTLSVHPGDLAVLAAAVHDPRVELVADPGLAPGDAELAGTWGRATLTRRALTQAALAALTDDGDLAVDVASGGGR